MKEFETKLYKLPPYLYYSVETMSKLALTRFRNKFLRETEIKEGSDSVFLNDLLRDTTTGFALESITSSEGLLHGAILFGESEEGKIISYLRQIKQIGGKKFNFFSFDRECILYGILMSAEKHDYIAVTDFSFEKPPYIIAKNYVWITSKNAKEFKKFAKFITVTDKYLEIGYCA